MTPEVMIWSGEPPPPESFSAKNFSRLANQIRADLTAKVDWDAAYLGCDISMVFHMTGRILMLIREHAIPSWARACM
jgi:hypothetical protein